MAGLNADHHINEREACGLYASLAPIENGNVDALLVTTKAR